MLAHGEIFLASKDRGIFLEGLEIVVGLEIKLPILRFIQTKETIVVTAAGGAH